MRRILLCNFANGRTVPTDDGLAILLGLNRDVMLERWDPRTGVDTLPTEWKRRGAKRSKTARDALGDNTFNVNLAYWAVRDLGARIDHDPAAGQTWAVIDE